MEVLTFFPADGFFEVAGPEKATNLAGKAPRLIQIRLTNHTLKKNDLGLSTQFVTNPNRAYATSFAIAVDFS
jgi:hypothetical protein